MLAAIGGANLAILGVAALATAGVILRPWKLHETVWAVLGALILMLAGLLPWHAAVLAVGHGTDVYLFLLIYGVGTVVTVFLSKDATAVVLTPAVFAAARAAGAKPLPYLFACAFVANAVSFVLPISNSANLVLYASRTPPLQAWFEQFLLPSALSIAATVAVLLLMERAAHGGLALGRFTASGVLVVLIVACILFIPQRAGRLPGEQGGTA